MTVIPKGIGADGLVRKTYTAALAPEDIDLEARTSAPTITTADPDRDKELVLPEAILPYLDGYLANPKFLWGHRRDGDPKETMGQCLSLSVIDKGWKAQFRHDGPEINPNADMVWKQTVAGSQRGYSICFLPVEWVTRKDVGTAKFKALQESYPDIAAWLIAGIVNTVYTVVELLEISAVHVPSGRKALLKSVKEAGMAKTVAKAGSTLNADNKDHAISALKKCEMGIRAQCAGMAHMNEIHKSAGGDDLYPEDFPTPDMSDEEEIDEDPELEDPDEEKGKSAKVAAVTKVVRAPAVAKHHALVKDVGARLRAAASSLEGPGDRWDGDNKEYHGELIPPADRIKSIQGILKSCHEQLDGMLPADQKDAGGISDMDGTQPQNVAMAVDAPGVAKAVEAPAVVQAPAVAKAVETPAVAQTESPQPVAKSFSAIEHLYSLL